MTSNHHYTCRCNACVRQRNARLQRQERRDIEDGNALPPGSYPYETPGDNPVIYADEAGDSPSRYSSPEQRRPGVLHLANCNCAVCAQLRQYLARDRPENPSSCQTGSPPAPAQLPTAMSNPQPASGPVASSSSQSGRWRWVVALLGCLLLAVLAAGIIIYGNPLQPAAVAVTPEPAFVAAPLPATPTMTPVPTAALPLNCSAPLLQWPLRDYHAGNLYADVPADPNVGANPIVGPCAADANGHRNAGSNHNPSPARPTATPLPTPTATPVLPSEADLIVNAFAECNGQYSGWKKNFRAQAASQAIADGQQTVADIHALIERHCDGAIPALPVVAGP